MNRRAILAIFLSTLAILAYEMFFLPKPPPPGEEPADGAPAVGELADPLSSDRVPGIESADPPEAFDSAPASETASGEAGGFEEGTTGGFPSDATDAATLVSSGDEAPARLVRVETPLYRVAIDTRGGVIASAELLAYENDERDGPVQLVAADSPGGLTLTLAAKDGNVSLENLVFRANRDRVRIDREDGVESLVLEQRLATGITVRRTWTFAGDSYRIGFKQDIVRETGAQEVFSYKLAWKPGVAITEGRPEIERDQVGAVTMAGQDIVRNPTHKIDEEGELHPTNVKWTAIKGKYFAVALLFEGDPGAEVLVRKAPGVDRAWFEAKIPIRSPMGSSDSFGLYLGPLDYEILESEGNGLERMIDLGWALIEPISRVLLVFMNFLYKFIPNYGWVIIIVSVVSKLILHPLSRKQFQSMKDMQKVQGPMQKLREKYKDDPQKLNKEMMELYRREGINPMGGCFPMLLQMPVFFALFQVLNKTIELRHAEWFGWINDLSRPEVLFEMPFAIPFLGSGFSLLPIVMGVLMFWQQKMSTVDPRQKAMIYMMPILFTFLFYRFPSGLVLYWLVNNVMSIAQQRAIHRSDDTPKDADTTTPQPPAGPPSKSGKAARSKKKKRATAKETT